VPNDTDRLETIKDFRDSVALGAIYPITIP